MKPCCSNRARLPNLIQGAKEPRNSENAYLYAVASKWGLCVCVCVLGVTVLKGQEEIEVHAPVVISNAGIFNTFQKFLPKHIQDKPGNTVLSL